MNIIRRILSLVGSRSAGRATGRPAGRRGARGRRSEPQATGIAALRRLISRR